MLLVSKNINDMLESTIDTVKAVLPMPITMGDAYQCNEPAILTEMGVLVGVTGTLLNECLLTAEFRHLED
ncbi:hypothetical protein HQN89_35290 [Paenibacillus frigoriresistens]|uniref:hypothetical protein n=1 Tax=Paenibacillus alginolyticus TaxID=59839 RepID=UPI00156696C9|nr:hypothetical protein [Paenibacillus frigoriresistens]NRF96065.1 hypothetical protein [Paenibacillus frigoriresistens]